MPRRTDVEKLEVLKTRLATTIQALEKEIAKHPKLHLLPRQPTRVKKLKDAISFTRKEISALEWKLESKALKI